jgi:hypothetical protein
MVAAIANFFRHRHRRVHLDNVANLIPAIFACPSPLKLGHYFGMEGDL